MSARTETQSPIGFDAFDDDLQTRGAIWSFLRYAADHLRPVPENAFWFNLVNSTDSGLANLTNAIGTAPNSLLRDWAISVYWTTTSPASTRGFSSRAGTARSVITNNGTSIAFPHHDAHAERTTRRRLANWVPMEYPSFSSRWRTVRTRCLR